MTTPRLRMAVVGVGSVGRHHARILAARPDVELVGVVDIDRSRAEAVAVATGAAPAVSVAGVLDRVDAVSIAVPTVAHVDVALPFLEKGVATLIEKPLARSRAEADRLVLAARVSGAVLATGHSERHNPAVREAMARVHRPRFIEVHRLGVFPERSLDVDVVFDVMIHDLDIVLAATTSEVAAVDAVGVPVLTTRVDIANARLRFESGCIANLTASRISRDRVRKIRFFQEESYVSVDCAAQEVEVWRLERRGAAPPVIAGGPIAVKRSEPLATELDDFVHAARSGRRPLVTGEDGRRALALAERIAREVEAGPWPASSARAPMAGDPV
jgi:predicted dehydrogenase